MKNLLIAFLILGLGLVSCTKDEYVGDEFVIENDEGYVKYTPTYTPAPAVDVFEIDNELLSEVFIPFLMINDYGTVVKIIDENPDMAPDGYWLAIIVGSNSPGVICDTVIIITPLFEDCNSCEEIEC